MTVSIQNAESGNSGSGWSWYTLGKDNDREGATLIVGDPQLGDAICESKEYKSGNYVRFVISFTDEDNVTPEQARIITKDWFDEYMTGFNADEYHLDIVEHTDTKQLHYHGRIPKVNTLTNTQLKLYWHKSDLDYKIAVNEVIAEKYNLILGTDHQRLVLPPQEKEKRIAKWRKEHGQEPYDLSSKQGKAVAEEGIADLINDLNTQGLVNSLDDVKAELTAMDFTIPNEGYDKGRGFHYLTIAQGDNKLRLKGDTYGERFYEHSREDRSKAISDNRSVGSGSRSDKRSRTDVTRALQKERSKRLKWIDKQYGGARARAIQRVKGEQRQPTEELHKDKKSTLESSSPYRPIDRRNHRNIGNSLLHPRPHQPSEAPRPNRDGRKNEVASTKQDSTRAEERPKHDKGIDNDRTTARAIKRAREAREQSEQRKARIRAELKDTIRANGEAVQRQLDGHNEQRGHRGRQLDSILANANKAEQPNYRAIEEATNGRQLQRRIRRRFRGFLSKFNERFEAIKLAVGGGNKELFGRILKTVKDKSMQELNNFKKNINLAEFSTAFGYYKDKDKSSLNAPVMRHDNGDKIIIGKDKTDGHYMYFNPSIATDKGTIIDFVKSRTNETLGHIRKRLRVWQHNPQPQENITVKASTKDSRHIANEWAKLKSDKTIFHGFQGIKRQLIEGLVKSNKAKKIGGDMYFMLSDVNGICGFEQRNTSGGKYIKEGSKKGLFTDGNLKDAKRIVIFESPMDMLAYRELKQYQEGDFSVCTMGSIGDTAKEGLKSIFEHNKTADVVYATDNDQAGQELAENIAILDKVEDRSHSMHTSKGKDWKKDLEAKQKKQQQSQSYSQGMSR